MNRILFGVGGIWVISAMAMVWLPVVVHLWLPDVWVPEWFPASPLEMMPEWLRWLPLPGGDAALIPLAITNAILALPGIALLLAAEKASSRHQR